MIVPHGEVGDGVAQPGIAGDAAGQFVGALEVGRVGGVEVAVDIVAGEDEKLGPIGENGIPDGLRLVLVGAGAERDARQRRAALRGERGGRQGGGGHELGKGATSEHGSHQNARISGFVGTIVKHHLKHVLEIVLVPLMAAIVFIEDVLLHYLGLAMAALAKWPPVARVEAWLRRLPPWAAVLAFVAPSALVLPVKLSAVWFAVHQRYGLSAVSIVIGKMLATALVARLYRVLRPTLVTMPWFLRAETWLFDWRDRLYAFVRALPAWRRAQALIRRARAWMAELVSGASPR